MDIEIGRRVMVRRRQLDIPASVIAAQCGLSVEEYRARERGEKRFSAVELLQIARALDTQVSKFFES